jgi:stage V sporulation protein B
MFFHINYVNKHENDYTLTLKVKVEVSFLPESKSHSYLKGAAILASAAMLARVISAIYKIPLYSILDSAGRGAFQVTYNVFALVLAIATAGVPAALSRIVSSARAEGNYKLAKHCFSVAMPVFLTIGFTAMLVMFFFSDNLAGLLNNSLAAPGIRVLAPAVLFVCIISVYRGYAQGHENMIPTAVSQIVEVVVKAGLGIIFALWFIGMGYAANIVSAAALTGVTVGLGICIPLLMWYNGRINRRHKVDSNVGNSPGVRAVFVNIMKVSLPISLSASFMAIMVLFDNAIVLGRLQSVLGYTEYEASQLMGIYALGLSVYNLPPAILVPVSVSIIPAIAAAISKKQFSEAGAIASSSVKLVNLIAMPAAAGIFTLAAPILIALYDYDTTLSTTILMILGVATFFVCLQFLTTAILQANGYERASLITFPLGAAAKISISYFLSGNPAFGILASPIGTLACFAVITILNIIIIKMRLPQRPKFFAAFIKPFVCAVIMAFTAFLSYRLFYFLGSGLIGTERSAVVLYLTLSIVLAIFVYGFLVVITRAVTKEDMKLVPKGELIGRLLKVR